MKLDMEFDHPVRVTSDGTITDDVTGIYAPEVTIASESDPDCTPMVSGMSGQMWYLLDGYSGQYGYAGPVMHASEFIGGHMAEDILADPGVYVAVVVTDIDASDDEDDVAGWAVAKLIFS